MRARHLAFVVLVLGSPALALTQAPTPPPHTADAAPSSKVWAGRHAEFETFLRTAPFTQFEDRLTQVDVRLTKTVRANRMRLRAMVDIYNLFNANTVLGVNTRYGPSWLQPSEVLAGRLWKFGAQFDF